LCDGVLGQYQNRLATGAKRAVLTLGGDFICFVGGFFTDPGKTSTRADGCFVHQLARAPAVDGLVVAASVLASEVGIQYVGEFCEKSGLPMVSVGKLPGIPHVLPDNRSGLRAVLEHLILHHHRQRFAFIRGIVNNPDALERESVFRQVLESHGLGVREDFFFPGDFIETSGALAVRELFDQRRYRFRGPRSDWPGGTC
jgi:hypothetical protein